MSIKFGWFIDWDGKARKTECPGGGYHCDVQCDIVEVCQRDGEVIFEATYWPDFDKMEQCLNDVGCVVVFR